MPPEHLPFVAFHPRLRVSRQHRQHAAVTLFRGYLTLACGMLGYTSQEAAEAFVVSDQGKRWWAVARDAAMADEAGDP